MVSFWDNVKEFLINIFQGFGWAWWVEIITHNPRCVYYFGPFLSVKDANAAKAGYIEDLENEGAQGIATIVKRCKPDNLTISDDLSEKMTIKSTPVFSSQM